MGPALSQALEIARWTRQRSSLARSVETTVCWPFAAGERGVELQSLSHNPLPHVLSWLTELTKPTSKWAHPGNPLWSNFSSVKIKFKNIPTCNQRITIWRCIGSMFPQINQYLLSHYVFILKKFFFRFVSFVCFTFFSCTLWYKRRIWNPILLRNIFLIFTGHPMWRWNLLLQKTKEQTCDQISS